MAEALAHGVPVLTTTGAPWPMLGERGCGWWVAPTVDGIADGLRQATSLDAGALAAMGERGRRWMAADFGWDAIAIGSADVADPLTLLAALAARTERVTLGAMVFAPTRRRPWTLAKQAITVDQLSNGRLVTPEDSHEFFSPPLPYLAPAVWMAITDVPLFWAAKLGQLGLSNVLAEEARPYGVRVTSVIAGAVDTPIWDDRPGFDRSKMMRGDDFAAAVCDLIRHPQVAIDEVVILPPGGTL